MGLCCTLPASVIKAGGTRQGHPPIPSLQDAGNVSTDLARGRDLAIASDFSTARIGVVSGMTSCGPARTSSAQTCSSVCVFVLKNQMVASLCNLPGAHSSVSAVYASIINSYATLDQGWNSTTQKRFQAEGRLFHSVFWQPLGLLIACHVTCSFCCVGQSAIAVTGVRARES